MKKALTSAILGTANGEKNEVTQFFANYDLPVEKGPTSDYLAFEKVGIPALTIAQYPVTDETGKDLPDDIDRINKTKLKKVADIILKALLQIK